MNINDPKDYELFLEHVPGVVVIDMAGTVVYLSHQCAQYMDIDYQTCMGKKIYDIFPETKMMENLNIDQPEIQFYHSFGIGVSVHVPVFCKGERVGLLEYDVVEASEVLYELADNYTRFLDRELNHLREEINELRDTKYSIDNIIGKSPQIIEMKKAIKQAAKSNSTVIIFGETGTGKEMVAHSIHHLSYRAKNSFVKINAANLPENLAESELFGYESGAFTGARKEGKKGKFGLADKGTLFIDEINQLPLSIQPKLLRVLQENEIEPIGSEESLPVDARIIVTTNQDLREMVKSGKFRQDLFFRLHVITIVVPPLRSRKSDIPLLVDHFVKDYSTAMGKHIIEIDERVYIELQAYSWPGNVRELQNVIERAVAFSAGTRLSLSDIDVPGWKKMSLSTESDHPIEDAKKELEREMIRSALKSCGGSKPEAAKLLKISRPLLYQKMERLGMWEKKSK